MNSELHFDVGLEMAIVAIPLSSFYIKAKVRFNKVLVASRNNL
jgi:hypothetical protein